MPNPSAFERLLDQLGKLPGIGRRSAERIAFDLLKRPADDVLELADALRAFKTDLVVCSICGNVSETDPCPICADDKRDASTVLVVEQPTDVASIEQTGAYRGRYHVLMGRLAPLDGVGPGELTLDRLVQRAKTEPIREIILGLNPTLEGDGTAMLIEETLADTGVNVTRLARGVPSGSTLQTVSKAVLSDAIQARR